MSSIWGGGWQLDDQRGAVGPLAAHQRRQALDRVARLGVPVEDGFLIDDGPPRRHQEAIGWQSLDTVRRIVTAVREHGSMTLAQIVARSTSRRCPSAATFILTARVVSALGRSR